MQTKPEPMMFRVDGKAKDKLEAACNQLGMPLEYIVWNIIVENTDKFVEKTELKIQEGGRCDW